MKAELTNSFPDHKMQPAVHRGEHLRKWYVYIIRSVTFPEQEYIGATADIRQRLKDHNSGRSAHTSKFLPWTLV